MKKKEEPKTPKGIVTKKINAGKFGFDLNAVKKTKNLLKTAVFKKEEWYELSPSFKEATGVPGPAKGHISIFRGHSDTGKTTAMVETAMAVQRAGDLPVFIITEMKWSWDHAKTMGFEVEEVVDKETGEVSYIGDFIYIDRGALNTVEDVAAFIADILDEQSKGVIPVNICFLWDSVGSIPSQQSYDSNKNNAMWNAGAMATQFGNFINQKIVLSRKDTSKYTNTLVVVNKIRVEYPMGGSPMEQPKMRNKGGDAMFWDATYVFTFGNIKGPGTTKVKAVKDGKQVEWAKIVKVSVDKNHMTGITTSGMIVTTIHGFISNEKKALEKYKKAHVNEWAQILGSTDFEIVEEQDNTEVKITEE